MGIYDRGYMNNAGTAIGRPRFSAVIVLIAVNVLVWILWQLSANSAALGQFMEANFLVSVPGILHGFRFHTLLTPAISHEMPGHLFFNMFFFWLVSGEIETVYGFGNFFVCYFFAGLMASLGYLGLAGWQHSSAPMLGASGAVMGVALAAAIFSPSRPISLLGILSLKLQWLVTVYIIADMLSAFSRDGVAHMGHLGGALGGYLFWKLDLRVFRSPGRSQSGLPARLRNLFRRSPKLRLVERPGASARLKAAAPAVPPPSSARSSAVDAETSRRVDDLLGKIHSHGIHALTDEERAFLNASSQKYKKKS